MPPMALGQRHSNLHHKANAFVQSAFLEEPSLERLLERFSTTVSFCTDLGTEAGLPELMVDVTTLLPPWMREEKLTDDGGRFVVAVGCDLPRFGARLVSCRSLPEPLS
jgi:hypothetical protein